MGAGRGLTRPTSSYALYTNWRQSRIRQLVAVDIVAKVKQVQLVRLCRKWVIFVARISNVLSIFRVSTKSTISNSTLSPVYCTGPYLFLVRRGVVQGQKTRRLRHFHYLEWPDNGVPDESSLLSFVEVVRDHIPVRGGPIVVHCRSVSAACRLVAAFSTATV